MLICENTLNEKPDSEVLISDVLMGIYPHTYLDYQPMLTLSNSKPLNFPPASETFNKIWLIDTPGTIIADGIIYECPEYYFIYSDGKQYNLISYYTLVPKPIKKITISKELFNIEIKVLNEKIREFGLPNYGTVDSAAIDLRACINTDIMLNPGKSVTIPTGIAFSINNPNIVGLISSRSGLYNKHDVRVGQGHGTLDSDYQGELFVMLHNDGTNGYIITPGERVAQLKFVPILHGVFTEVKEFSIRTNRGEGGLGHTGKL